MGDQRKSGIAWTDQTWNPIRGCSRVSEGCRHCYAEQMAARFCGEGQPYHGLATRSESGPRWTGKVELISNHLDDPLRWRRPRRVFVNSMSDLFHDGVSNEQIAAIFGIMAASPSHTFQVLTKRARRMREWFSWASAMYSHAGQSIVEICLYYARHRCSHKAIGDMHRDIVVGGMEPVSWPLPNVWLGVSTEDQSAADKRIPLLLGCPAAVRWVSVEPMIGPVSLEQYADVASCGPDGEADDPERRLGLNWVVVGGESGPRARPMSVEWVEDLVSELRRCDVSAFVKQLGAHPTRDVFSEYHGEMDTEPLLLRHNKGGDMSEWPEVLRVRQWPKKERRDDAGL